MVYATGAALPRPTPGAPRFDGSSRHRSSLFIRSLGGPSRRILLQPLHVVTSQQTNCLPYKYTCTYIYIYIDKYIYSPPQSPSPSTQPPPTTTSTITTYHYNRHAPPPRVITSQGKRARFIMSTHIEIELVHQLTDQGFSDAPRGCHAHPLVEVPSSSYHRGRCRIGRTVSWVD